MLIEIQIRSILQHAWAEIEHDLGYKSKEAAPSVIRRRLSRLAGLLELADDEFSRIRDDVERYRQEVRKEIPTTPASIALDQASLSEFIDHSHRVKEMDEKIAGLVGATVTKYAEGPGLLVHPLRFLGFENLAELGNRLDTLRGSTIRFARAFLADAKRKSIPQGTSIFHMCNVIVAPRGREAVIEYLIKGVVGTREDVERNASKILEAWREASAEEHHN
jgi:hypothetical protein